MTALMCAPWVIRTPHGDYQPKAMIFSPSAPMELSEAQRIWFFARYAVITLDRDAVQGALALYDALSPVAFRCPTEQVSRSMAEQLADWLDHYVVSGHIGFDEILPIQPVEAPREQKEVPAPRPATVADAPFLSLTVQTISGDPVDDDAGFLLIKPDGAIEPASLSGGAFERKSISAGEHRVRFKHLRDAQWSTRRSATGEKVPMRVAAPGFDDGTTIVFRIYASAHPYDAQPVAEVQAQVSGGEASASWEHAQAMGSPAAGEFVFEAEIGSKRACSDVLYVAPHPTSDLRGVKERLRQRGYDCGAPGTEATPELEQALKSFQESQGFTEHSGRLDEATIQALEMAF